MSTKIVGDFQTQPGDLLDVPRSRRQWPDVHANPGDAVILLSTDPGVPPGCPTPLVLRLTAAPYAALGNRMRADVGQAHAAFGLDGSHGMRRYAVGCFYAPTGLPDSTVIVFDYHSDYLGSHALRFENGQLQQKVMAGERLRLGAPHDAHRLPAPKGWEPYAGEDYNYAFASHTVLPLGPTEALTGRWVVVCLYWRWFADDRGGVTVWIDGDEVADWTGATVAFDSVTGVRDQHYAKVDCYLPGGPDVPVSVFHTGWRIVTRWREAQAVMRALGTAA